MVRALVEQWDNLYLICFENPYTLSPYSILNDSTIWMFYNLVNIWIISIFFSENDVLDA